MDREVCHVYSYFNLDLVNTVTNDLVYHDSVDEYIRLVNKRFGGRIDRHRLVTVVNRNSNHMINEDNIASIKDYTGKKAI